VAGGLRQRALLAPAGHAAVDEARVALERDVGPEAKALHHLRAEAFDQHVGGGDQVERLREMAGVLEVELDDLAARLTKSRGLRRPCPGRAIDTTSAPMSDNSIAANGPGRCRRIPPPARRAAAPLPPMVAHASLPDRRYRCGS